jgi:beta-ureidopropionase / N-carbamoyl-L-amino-acid hydrolase
MKAFFELHIEQGPILEDEGKDIGVVTHGQGLWWLQVTLTGKESHTGSTPMPKRRNAGLGMARVPNSCTRSRWTTSPMRSVRPAMSRSIPIRATSSPARSVFTIDIRSPDLVAHPRCAPARRASPPIARRSTSA